MYPGKAVLKLMTGGGVSAAWQQCSYLEGHNRKRGVFTAVSFPHKQTSRVGSRLTSPPVSLPSLSVQHNHSEPTAGGGDTRQSEEKRLGRTFCVPSRSPGEGESIRQQPRTNLARTRRRRSCNDPPPFPPLKKKNKKHRNGR